MSVVGNDLRGGEKKARYMEYCWDSPWAARPECVKSSRGISAERTSITLPPASSLSQVHYRATDGRPLKDNVPLKSHLFTIFSVNFLFFFSKYKPKCLILIKTYSRGRV